MDKIGALFVNAGIDTSSKESFKNTKSESFKNKDKHTKHRPWYSQICENKKVIFNKMRKKYRIFKSETNLQNMKNASKEYEN